MVWKITFTTVGDIPWMLQFFTHVHNCVMGATPMATIGTVWPMPLSSTIAEISTYTSI